MDYINCTNCFRSTKQSIDGTRYEQSRTFWSLVCEVLYKNGELTKDEIISKIGYCSSQSQVWSSLKHWKIIERVPKSWKLRLTEYGRRYFYDLATKQGVDLNHSLERTGWIKKTMNDLKIHEMQKDF